MRRVTPIFQQQGGGAVVNISSFAADAPEQPMPVSSLRAALSAWTRLYAERYAAENIRMNAVLPGFIDSWPETPEIVARIPAGRFGKTGEIAKTVAFLLRTGRATSPARTFASTARSSRRSERRAGGRLQGLIARRWGVGSRTYGWRARLFVCQGALSTSAYHASNFVFPIEAAAICRVAV